MRFVSMLRVQSGDARVVPDPMEPKFNLAVFHQVFLANTDGSPEDVSARMFGELIAMRAERLFATLEDAEKRCRRFTFDEVAKAVAAFTQRQQVTSSGEYASALSNLAASSTWTVKEALLTMRTTRDPHGNSFTQPEVMEATIDGVRQVLRHARDRKGFGGAGDQPEAVDIDAVLPVVVRLGHLYESLRNQWHAFLWGNARVHVEQQPPFNYAIDKTNSALELMACVDLQRRQVTLGREVSEAKEVYLRRGLETRRVLIWQDAGHEGRRLATATISSLAPEQRRIALELAVAQAIQLDIHIEFFLEKSHASLKGVPYRKVLEAWYCIALLTMDDFLSAMRALDEERTSKDAPVTCLPVDELIQALSEILSVEAKQAKAVVGFLTYKGGHQTLWSRPLLETKDGMLALWCPLQSGHLMRLVADWGKADTEEGAQFSDKGHRYEDVVHGALSILARIGHPTAGLPVVPYVPLGPRLSVPGKAADGNDVGDVDAAFIVGRTLFILECRAVGYPVEPYEVWSTHEELKGKIRQVLRKKNHLTSNPDVVRGWLQQAHQTEAASEIENVVALVVSNSFLLEGERNEEPYFVHFDTLFNLLLTFRSSFGAGQDEHEQTLEFHVDFRRDGASDADAVTRALKRPPKAEAYKACIAPLDITIPPFDDSDSSGVVRNPVMILPRTTPDVEALLARCSFAGQIIRLTTP